MRNKVAKYCIMLCALLFVIFVISSWSIFLTSKKKVRMIRTQLCSEESNKIHIHLKHCICDKINNNQKQQVHKLFKKLPVCKFESSWIYKQGNLHPERKESTEAWMCCFSYVCSAYKYTGLGAYMIFIRYNMTDKVIGCDSS